MEELLSIAWIKQIKQSKILKKRQKCQALLIKWEVLNCKFSIIWLSQKKLLINNLFKDREKFAKGNFAIRSTKMVENILDTCIMEKEMDKELFTIKMEAIIRVIGKIIWWMVKESYTMILDN